MRALPLSTGRHDDAEDRYDGCSRRLPDRVRAQAVRDRVEQDARRVVKLSLSLRSELLAAILVSGLVGAASAECAWVLWQEEPVRSQHWSLAHTMQIAFTTKDACEFVANGAFQNRARMKEETVRCGGKNLTSIFFTCLPDTVDPRGPKGK